MNASKNKLRTIVIALVAIVAVTSLQAQTAKAVKAANGAPPKKIPTFSTADLSRTGIYYAGGKYVGAPGKEVMEGSAYVDVWVPKQIKHPYPIVYIHGAGQTATDWQQTPDGRPGWAYYFAKQGYVQYMVDSPARGRSPYVPDHDGNLNIRTAANLDAIKSPVIILSHSQGGAVGWLMADARPNQVKGIVTVEPGGPPIKNVDTAKVAYNTAATGGMSWGVTASPITYDPPIKNASELQVALEEKSDIPGDVVPCYVQKEPAHKLVNLTKIPVVYLSAEGGYHREFDHCLAKWLNQAGVKTQFVRMEDAGLRGNGHEMMLEKNSDEIAKWIGGWMDKNIPQKDKP